MTGRDVLIRGLRLMARGVREEPRTFAVSVGGAALTSLLTIGAAYVIGAVVTRVVVPALESGTVAASTLALAAAVFLAVGLLKAIGIVARRLGAGYMYVRLQTRYRSRLARRYLDLPPAWHHRHATGTLLSNASSDVDAVWLPTSTLAYALATVILLGTTLGALLLTDWVLALVGLAIFPALFGVNAVYSRRVAARYAATQELRAQVSAVAHESFDGALVVKAMGKEDDETTRFAVKVDELRDSLISIGRVRGVYDPIVEALPSAGTLAVLLVGAWRLQAGAIGVGELVSAAFLFALLDVPVRAIGWLLTSLPFAVAGWDRVHPVLTATGEMTYGDATLDGDPPAELRFDRVGFDRVGFDRVGFDQGPDHPVLTDVSLAVPPGRVMALVGPTGSGKSTIASLAVRMVDPVAGTVRLDGVDVRDLRAACLADTVALVPQIPFAFDDTVRANVTLGRPGIDDERVWWALRLAQADDFVAHLPDGLDTELGERGVLLSGGQRQRLTLARAMAGRPRLLVLDDATSAVDPRVEAAILASLRSSAMSILVVAHRPATIAIADDVVYLEQGRVVAAGRHAELLATVPSYADLITRYERAAHKEAAYEAASS